MTENNETWVQGSDEYEDLLAALDMADVMVRPSGLQTFRDMRDRLKVQPHSIVADADLQALLRLARVAVDFCGAVNLENTCGWTGVDLLTALTPITAKGGVMERMADGQ